MIESALNILYQRELQSREQLLKEMLRVKMTLTAQVKSLKQYDSEEKLFQLMKQTTENELGFFPADRADFIAIYEALKEIDLLAFTLYIYNNDRMGTIISPSYLTQFIKKQLSEFKPKTALITEAEKHLAGLKEIVTQNQQVQITLTTENKLIDTLLRLLFEAFENVKVQFESIYSECLIDEKFDYIFSLPAWGCRLENPAFIGKESDAIATENMLNHLTVNGKLEVIVPGKFTFSGADSEKLRTYINEKFNVEGISSLPEGTFKPYTAIKSYLLTLTVKPTKTVAIGNFVYENKKLAIQTDKAVIRQEFKAYKDWRIELLLAEEDENLQRYKKSEIPKVKLKDIAEVFRGKSILKKDTSLGEISVLNISNIENGEINYENLDTVDEEERKVKRYELHTGDVVLSCRGTALKIAYFEAREKTIIASANLIVIRPNEQVKGEFIKMFLESPVGLVIIKSFQRGTTIMNINNTDIMEMEIPLLSCSQQEEMITAYQKELNTYKEAINQAEARWSKTKEIIYNKMT